MEVITFDRFEGGIDLRKAEQVSDANRLVECKNAYITTGWAVRKRPGLDEISIAGAFPSTATTLPSRTKGLFVFNKQMHTCSNDAVLAADMPVLYGYGIGTGKVGTTIEVHVLPNPADATDTISKIWDAQVYANQLYIVVEYTSGTIQHFYNDVAVTDANCPQSNSITIAADKIYAVKTDDGLVRYSKSGDPTNWSEKMDAGGKAGLPTGREAPGDAAPLALGSYRGKLVVFQSDSAQVWSVDVDPNNIEISTVLSSIGSQWTNTILPVGDDLFFLTDSGFRSIGQQIYTGNLQDTDVGSPIDSIVHDTLMALTRLGIGNIEPISAFFHGLGQYICAIGTELFVFTFSRMSKVTAWSRYIMPDIVTALAPYGEYMFIRLEDDTVNIFNPDSFQDANATPIPLEITSSYQAFKKPGRWKQIMGADVMFNGTAEVQHRWDARSPLEETTAISLSSDTRPGPMIPVELMTTECGFKITQSANTEFQLNGVTYYYELLGEL
jgi:hypothetical protein